MTLLSQRGTLRRGGAPAVSDTAPVPASIGQLWVDTSAATTPPFAVVPPPTGVAATDTANIEAACATGARWVVLHPGTYAVNFQAVPGFAGYQAAVIVRPGQLLVGAGQGATTIRLASGQTFGGAACIIRNPSLSGGDTELAVADLTIDGNGAAYGSGAYYQGISFLRARGIRVSRVTVKNVYGDAAFPPGETFHFDVDSCVDVIYTDCTALGDAGTQGSGFADNSSTGVHYKGCIAHGMSAGMGFASWHGSVISYSSCHAYLCGANAFNCEFGNDITYEGCISGGLASDQAGGYFYANSAVLGSYNGFVANASANVVYSGCIASHNTQNGFVIVSTGGVGSSAYLVNCLAHDSVAVGVVVDAASITAGTRIDKSVQSFNNGTANFNANGTVGYYGGTGPNPWLLAAPAVPASGTPVTNPYPCDVKIYLNAPSSFFTLIGGANIGVVSGLIELPAGSTVQLNYGSAPTWVWVRG